MSSTSTAIQQKRKATELENSRAGGPMYIINAMFMFTVMGMCIKMFFGNNTSKDGTYGRANSTIWGYGIAALSIITVMFVGYAIHDRISKIEKKGLNGIISFIKSFLTSSGPAILTVILLLWIVTLNIFHFYKINKGQVASEYYQLSAGTSFLFIFQIICVFQYLKTFIRIKTGTSEDEKEDAKNLSRISFAVYFITTINMVVAGMMSIILMFFSTDG
jgi:hypothetical protein